MLRSLNSLRTLGSRKVLRSTQMRLGHKMFQPSTQHVRVFSWESKRELIKPPSGQPAIPVKLEERKETALDVVRKDRYLSRFITKTYAYTGGSIAASLIGMQVMAPMAVVAPVPFFVSGIVGGIGGAVALGYTKYEKKYNEEEGHYTVNSTARKIAFWSIVAGMSACTAPMVGMVSPGVLPLATGLSIATMGGASLFAYMRPSGSLLKYQAPLFGGLVGLIGVGLTGIASTYFLGPHHILSQVLMDVNTYGGIVLFTGITAYDTHLAIKLYEKGDADHLGCCTSFYLDFMNFLTRFMAIIQGRKD